MRYSLAAGLALTLITGFAPAIEFTRTQAGRIAQAVGDILDQAHYKRVRLDDTLAEMHLKNYLDMLDFNHMFFLQSDVDDFTTRLAHSLDDLTRKGEVAPAFEIYERYTQRLETSVALVQRLLKEPQDFSKDEKFIPVRNKLPWPKNDAEAEELWRTRIKFELLQGKLTDETPAKSIERISKRYARVLRDMKKLDSSEVLQIYLSALGHAFDPHSDYMPPADATNFDIHNVKLTLSGIGAVLRQTDDGYTEIQSLQPGGPAALSKQIKPKDRIVAVGQGTNEVVDVVDTKLGEVVDQIRGQKGTEVRLMIIPADAVSESTRKEVRLVRDEIKLSEQYAFARIVDHLDADGKMIRLGVIDLPQFYENCAKDVEKLITRLQKEGVRGLILDLRRNGGGLLNEAVDLTGLFIKKGPVVQVRDNRQRVQVLEDEDARMVYEGPLLVFVGRHSASASEIVAAALQDYGRALIVGDQATHGKGTVQTLFPLQQWMRPGVVADPGRLKFTISKFYRIAGGTTQKNGVTPDIILPNVLDYLETGEAFLPNCLPADNIPPAAYQRQDRISPFVEDLRVAHSGRLKSERDFAYIAEDIERVKVQRLDRSVSLNEAARLKEKKEIEARLEARKQERDARKPSEDKVFLAKLDIVDKDQPIVPVAATKPKAIEKPSDLPADLPDDEGQHTDADKGNIDTYLRGALNILSDYARLAAKDERFGLAAGGGK